MSSTHIARSHAVGDTAAMEHSDADKTLETTPPPDTTDKMHALDILEATGMLGTPTITVDVPRMRPRADAVLELA